MEWFEKVKKSVTKTAKEAVKVSGDALEYTKIKIKLSDINSSIDELYTKMGKVMYNSIKSDEEPQIDIDEIVAQIDELKLKAYELEETLAQVTNKVACPACGAKQDAESAFCSVCGEKIK